MKSFCLGAATVLGLTLAGSALADDVRMLAIEPNVPEGRQYYLDVAKAYEAANPGTKVQFDFLDDTSFKSKLPTLLQSSARPDAFFTWTGGVFYEQAKAGVLKDISVDFTDADRKNYSPSGIQSMSHDGKLYGVPMYAASVVLWYNKALVEKAGVDPKAIKNWEDLLAASKKIQGAGIVPIVMGGKDKWPIALFYGQLAARIAGTDGVAAADKGENEGFNNPAFVQAGEALKQLADLKPFQPGYMDTTQPKAAGLFGDGKGAFYLAGNFLVGAQAQNSASGKGLGDDLDFITFPAVDGGKGDPADTFGGVNGWLVTKDAGKSTVDFLKFLTNNKNQTEGGRLKIWLPIGTDAQSGIADPRLRRIAEGLSKAPHHQLYLDQMLGASVGAALNDAAAQIVTGDISPEEAAALVEEAREMR